MLKRILINRGFINLLKEEVLSLKVNIIALFLSIIATAIIDVNLLKLIGEFAERINNEGLDFKFLLILIVIFSIKLVCVFILYSQTSYLSNIITLKLKSKIFDKVINSKIDLNKTFTKGDIFHRLFVEVGLLQGKLVIGTVFFIKDILFLVVICINLIVVSKFLFFSLIVFYTIFLLYNNNFFQRIERFNKIIMRKNSRLSAFFNELLLGKKDIFIYNLNRTISDKINSISHKLGNNYKSYGKYFGVHSLFLEAYIFLFFILILYLLMFQKNSISHTVTSIAYLLAMVWPIKEINSFITSLRSLIPSLERIEALLIKTIMPPSSFERKRIVKNLTSPQILISGIVFNHQPNGDYLFNGNNFNFSKGLHLIKGKNGSGKTTLLEIIAGIKDPVQGFIEITTKKENSNVYLAQQNPFLFKTSVLENIRIIDSGISEKDIFACIQKFGIDEVFKNNFGSVYKLVGENGESISAGEKQLISMVRALITEPEVLLMDEVTSGLSQNLSITLLNRIAEHRSDKINILVSHQHPAQVNFDSIINFDNK